MKYTNVHNLPDAIVRMVTRDVRPVSGTLRVTELADAPQRRILKMLHWDEITVEVADRGFMLLGLMAHALLEGGAGPNDLAEERLNVEVEGWTVSGQSDLFEDVLAVEGGTLIDYKTTGAATTLPREAHVAQLNSYAFLWREHGFSPSRLQIVPIWRDWKRPMRGREGYPTHSMGPRIDVPLWGHEETGEYIARRVRVHEAAEQGIFAGCSDAERWKDPDVWAVHKRNKDGKPSARAAPGGLRPSEEEAERYAIAHAPELSDWRAWFDIQFRPGTSKRCHEGWCELREVCDQAKALEGTEAVEPALV